MILRNKGHESNFDQDENRISLHDLPKTKINKEQNWENRNK